MIPAVCDFKSFKSTIISKSTILIKARISTYFKFYLIAINQDYIDDPDISLRAIFKTPDDKAPNPNKLLGDPDTIDSYFIEAFEDS